MDGIYDGGIVTPFADIDLGQRWFRQWLVAWQHQAIAWTYVDFNISMTSIDI